MHFIQLYTTRRCQLYNHGSAAANVAASVLLLLLLLPQDTSL
jgi:hypothetical protein